MSKWLISLFFIIGTLYGKGQSLSNDEFYHYVQNEHRVSKIEKAYKRCKNPQGALFYTKNGRSLFELAIKNERSQLLTFLISKVDPARSEKLDDVFSLLVENKDYEHLNQLVSLKHLIHVDELSKMMRYAIEEGDFQLFDEVTLFITSIEELRHYELTHYPDATILHLGMQHNMDTLRLTTMVESFDFPLAYTDMKDIFGNTVINYLFEQKDYYGILQIFQHYMSLIATGDISLTNEFIPLASDHFFLTNSMIFWLSVILITLMPFLIQFIHIFIDFIYSVIVFPYRMIVPRFFSYSVDKKGIEHYQEFSEKSLQTFISTKIPTNEKYSFTNHHPYLVDINLSSHNTLSYVLSTSTYGGHVSGTYTAQSSSEAYDIADRLGQEALHTQSLYDTLCSKLQEVRFGQHKDYFGKYDQDVAYTYTCTQCGGSGTQSCISCGGSGSVQESYTETHTTTDSNGNTQTEYETQWRTVSCMSCGGSGRQTCSTCGGTGVETDVTTVELYIDSAYKITFISDRDPDLASALEWNVNIGLKNVSLLSSHTKRKDFITKSLHVVGVGEFDFLTCKSVVATQTKSYDMRTVGIDAIVVDLDHFGEDMLMPQLKVFSQHFSSIPRFDPLWMIQGERKMEVFFKAFAHRDVLKHYLMINEDHREGNEEVSSPYSFSDEYLKEAIKTTKQSLLAIRYYTQGYTLVVTTSLLGTVEYACYINGLQWYQYGYPLVMFYLTGHIETMMYKLRLRFIGGKNLVRLAVKEKLCFSKWGYKPLSLE